MNNNSRQISLSRQLRKLPRQSRTGMAPSEKVGSWLTEKQAQESAEAYDSGSASEAESSKDAVKTEKREEVDWNDVLGRIRLGVADKSPKRRQAFIARNLYVTEDSPPTEHLPSIVSSLLAVLGLSSDPAQIDDIVTVLIDLVKRDEKTDGKLGDKLVKWLQIEGDKAANSTKASTPAGLLPYTFLNLALLQQLGSSRDNFNATSTFNDLINSLALLTDAIEARELDPSTSTLHPTAKITRFRRKVGIRIWRTIRDIRECIPTIIETLTKSSTPKSAVLLRHVIGVCLRLKSSAKRPLNGRETVEGIKGKIVDWYTTNVLGSKVIVPRHTSGALNEFHKEFTDIDTLSTKVLPTAEKMLLRSPEVALDLTSDLLSGLPYDLSSILPGKLVTAALSASKSSNPDTRSKSLHLMEVISQKCQDTTIQSKIVTEILSLPKTGKTSSPEHRIVLFQMTALFPVNDNTSPIVVDTLPGLCTKEGNDNALQALCGALIPHLSHSFTSNTPIASAAVLAKELGSTKVSARRALANAVGEAVWIVHSRQSQFSNEGEKLLEIIMPGLETALNTSSTNQPANNTGFLEGYVGVALSLGPLHTTPSASKLAQVPALADILAVNPKPSFVLNDKIYTRLPAPEDEKWLLRCLEGIINRLGRKLEKDDAARLAVGMTLIHLAFESKSSEVRRITTTAISDLAKSHPRLVSHLIRDSLKHWLQVQDARAPRIRKADEEEIIESKSRDIGKLLSAVFHHSNTSSTDKAICEDIAVDYIVLAHHPEINEDAQVSWIALVQSLGLDPATVAVDKRTRILESLWEAASTPPTDPRLGEAAYRAITTLAFVQPEIYVQAVLEKLEDDLDPASLDFIGLEERGIWASPPDQLFVDAPKKDNNENKNSKNYANEKWEQEIRDSIAAKKASQPGNVKLSKADQALVAAQRTKEAETRTKIATTQAKLVRGVALIRCLVASNSEHVARHLRVMAECMLASVFGRGSFLVDKNVFAVFLSLGSLAHDRLGEYRRMLAAAILRSHDAPFIHDDYLQEGKSELVTRLLHQVDFVAQQTPLDSTTYGLASMLLSQVTALGGIGTEANSDEAQEQLTLAVSITGACVGEFSDQNYPRLETIRDLLRMITTYPRLGKEAAQSLKDLGDAIKDVASVIEVQGLVAGTLSKDLTVRKAALEALQPVDMTELDYSEEIWIAVHDADEQNASLALHLWDDNGLDLPETFLTTLPKYLAHESSAVRISTAGAIAEAVQQYPAQIEPTVNELQAMYADKARMLQPEYDRFGMIIPETVNRTDPFEARVAIALSFERLAPLMSDALVDPVFEFFVVKEALGDRHGAVRRGMLDAATAIIDLHGQKSVAELMKMFEDYLGRSGPSSETADYIKEAVVILFGRLARHLDTADERIPKVVDRLIEALNTPSELVQSAVADCLPPLVQDMGEEVEYLVDKLFSNLTTGAKYAARRGAAYGLAGIIKGRGLQSLKEYELMDKLVEAAEDKASYQSRQGALFAFETLSGTLGKLFEPYIISIVPLLLVLFGDGNADVREAVQDSSRVIMSRISGHCVKLMLPTLLGGLDEKQWRTKKGSIELLGAMAFCAPRQLSLSLPTIIPHLTGVINDSHAQVKSAANASLKRFGEVLSNPEIKALQSVLMKALADPTANINKALTSLLKTSFEHYLDAPSLALVMPIIDRGLKQRSSEIKRKSVQIVGNMASLTEARDLTPYLDQLMPLLHEVLVDPVPEARATAAKSLGTLVERLGEPSFPELVNQLMSVLRSDTGGIDRQGSAQGLSEVLSALGMERMEGLLPEVITNTSSPRAYVREGFISLLVYLPATFGHRFAPHLGRVIPPILNGLADSSEYVREASLNAGKMIISNYSTKAIDLLLPELEKGMLDIQWRIRSASIELTGLLLYRVTGISGKVDLEEGAEAPQAADNARKALLDALGQERRDRILATLYIVRQDTVNVVRSSSIHIWKALVQNTPRTTREILPVLMQMIMSLLGSPEVEQQETASRTLGELCRKNGERIFSELVPILQKAITSTDPRTKEGACLAFADIMVAASKDAVEDHQDAIISAVRSALVDSNATVRSAAARTFDVMQQYLGAKAIDQTIPTLLEAMRDPGETSETALKALQEVMSVRANTVFPVLIPTLTAQPITAFNARALGALVKVAGSALNRRLDSVLGALVKSLEKETNEEIKGEIQSAIESLLESVSEEEGIHQLQMLLISWAKDKNPTRRATGCNLFGTLCQVNSADNSDYRVDWIRILVSSLDDSVEEVVTAAWEAMDIFTKSIEKDELDVLVVPLRRAIEGTGSPGKTVPGFSRPKGLQPIVPIILAGVLSGTQEQKEQATLAIGDLAQRTSEQAIKVYIIQLTGPLIRILTVPVSPQIKSAVLSTLTVLLEEIPQLVKPFHPQLTRTFVKSASDPGGISIRSRAAAGLGALMKHQPRVDPVVTELIGGVRGADNDIAPSIVLALAAVCKSAGKNIGEGVRGGVVELVEEAFMGGRNENYDKAIARVISGLAVNDPEFIRSIVDTFLAAPTPPTALVSHSILACLEDCPEAFYDLDVVTEIVKKVQSSVSSDNGSIGRPARDARDLMKKLDRWEGIEAVQSLL